MEKIPQIRAAEISFKYRQPVSMNTEIVSQVSRARFELMVKARPIAHANTPI